MTFSDLYYFNSDWETSTVLEINICLVNKKEELPVSKALLKYSDYEVVIFRSNWVVLRAPEGRPPKIRRLL